MTLDQLGDELERAAKIFTARDIEQRELRTREGGGQLMAPEVAEARRALRAIAIKFADEARKEPVQEPVQ